MLHEFLLFFASVFFRKILLTILYNATERDFRNSFKQKSYSVYKKKLNTYNRLVGSTYCRSEIPNPLATGTAGPFFDEDFLGISLSKND